MAVEAREPLNAFETLKQHHLENMRPELKRAIVRRAWNQQVADIARQEHVSCATVKQRLGAAPGELFDTLPEGFRRDPYTAATWVSCHLACCLQEAVQQLRDEAAA